MRLELPLQGLMPIYLPSSQYQIALVLEQPKWIREQFSQTGLKDIPTDVKGVYQLLGASDMVLRIGEGTINARVREHLKDERFSAVRSVQYFNLSDKAETEIWERILIAQYEIENGELPPINRIRA